MTLAQTYSWIFYSIALASQKKAASQEEICTIADGINHAVPTQKEISTSISWTISQGLVLKEGKRFRLSLAGTKLFRSISDKPSTIFGVWKQIEASFVQKGVDDARQINPKNMNTEI